MGDSRKMLVIGAHSADFVWRAAGAMAVTTAKGGTAEVIALSYGERGESGELWKEPGQTVENVKRVREAEAREAAEAVGATFRCLDLAYQALAAGGIATTVLNAANEEAVAAFLDGSLPFLAIAETIERCLETANATPIVDLAAVLDADLTARRRAQRIIATLSA